MGPIHPKCLCLAYIRRVYRDVENEVNHGLSPGQLVDIYLEVAAAEKSCWYESDDILPESPRTPVAKRAVVNLSLRGFDDEFIETMLDLPAGAAARVLESSRFHPKGHQIVAAHLAGDPPSRISRNTGVGVATVIDILERIGETPHRLRDLAKSSDVNRSIKRRYQEGWSYKRIAEALDISETKVKNRIQYLRKKGEIDATPRPGSNVTRRKPRAAD